MIGTGTTGQNLSGVYSIAFHDYVSFQVVTLFRRAGEVQT